MLSKGPKRNQFVVLPQNIDETRSAMKFKMLIFSFIVSVMLLPSVSNGGWAVMSAREIILTNRINRLSQVIKDLQSMEMAEHIGDEAEHVGEETASKNAEVYLQLLMIEQKLTEKTEQLVKQMEELNLLMEQYGWKQDERRLLFEVRKQYASKQQESPNSTVLFTYTTFVDKNFYSGSENGK